MLALRVTVPIACFRKGMAREYLETEPIPPPATCYGFLLSLVGETDRRRHIGCRVTPQLLNAPSTSVVLRTVWRVKQVPLGSPDNTRPDYQQLLSPVHLIIWLDSTEDRESSAPLESRVRMALHDPASIRRFGGLSLGESTHLVDEIDLVECLISAELQGKEGKVFLRSARGRLNLPVWVDHVGSKGTRYVAGDLTQQLATIPPGVDQLPIITPE